MGKPHGGRYESGAEMTGAELDALIAEQRRCLPFWWWHEVELERQRDAEAGRLVAEAEFARLYPLTHAAFCEFGRQAP